MEMEDVMTKVESRFSTPYVGYGFILFFGFLAAWATLARDIGSSVFLWSIFSGSCLYVFIINVLRKIDLRLIDIQIGIQTLAELHVHSMKSEVIGDREK